MITGRLFLSPCDELINPEWWHWIITPVREHQLVISQFWLPIGKNGFSKSAFPPNNRLSAPPIAGHNYIIIYFCDLYGCVIILIILSSQNPACVRECRLKISNWLARRPIGGMDFISSDRRKDMKSFDLLIPLHYRCVHKRPCHCRAAFILAIWERDS